MALLHMASGRGNVTNDGSLCITAEGGLQDACEFGVSIWDMATCKKRNTNFIVSS